MTDIEQKALALVNAVFRERGHGEWVKCTRKGEALTEALCRAIEQHEAFKQEVSDAVEKHKAGMYLQDIALDRFIIPKPDPLVEALKELEAYPTADELRAAIEKRGGKIVWGEKQ